MLSQPILLNKAILKFFKTHQILFFALFGSRARGDARAKSDFDFVFFAKKKLPFEKKTELMNLLIESIHFDKIDLVDFKTAPPLLLKQIFSAYNVLWDPKAMESILLNQAFGLFRDHKLLYQLKGEQLRSNAR